jgi:hypothetical protein
MSDMKSVNDLIAHHLKQMRQILMTVRVGVALPPSADLCAHLDLLLKEADICKGIVQILMEMKEDMLDSQRRMTALVM